MPCWHRQTLETLSLVDGNGRELGIRESILGADEGEIEGHGLGNYWRLEGNNWQAWVLKGST